MTTLVLASVLRQSAPSLHQKEYDGFRGSLLEFLNTVSAEGGPSFRGRIFDGDRLRRYLNVFVDGTDVRYLSGLATPITPTSRVDLIPAVAGG
ncbi:MAG: MoaD/ThiS family protein [Thermoplasmata archaeon]|nr:MoaD/ThiS family protein [Thermoplasmata archaeon]